MVAPGFQAGVRRGRLATAPADCDPDAFIEIVVSRWLRAAPAPAGRGTLGA